MIAIQGAKNDSTHKATNKAIAEGSLESYLDKITIWLSILFGGFEHLLILILPLTSFASDGSEEDSINRKCTKGILGQGHNKHN